MTSLKLVKDMRTSSVSALKLLTAFIFGDKDIKTYVPTQIYNQYDQIIKIDEGGHISVWTCKEDGITGVYNETKWELTTVQDSLGGGGSTGGVEVSEIRPYDERNQIWWHIKNMQEGEDPYPAPVVVNKGLQVIAQDEMPVNDEIVLWLDFEA